LDVKELDLGKEKVIEEEEEEEEKKEITRLHY